MHKWYDALQEPTRFIVFFGPAVILMAGMNIPHYGINYVSAGLLLLALVSRMIYMHKYTRILMTFIKKSINACRGGQ